MIKLKKEEAKRIRNLIIEKWDAGESYCYPLHESDRDDFICFPQDFFLEDFGLTNLKEVLKKLNIENCYRLDEYHRHNEDYKIDLDKIVEYDGLEKYYCDESNSWLIYFSHENTITFGGEKLIQAIKTDWKNWKKVAFKWYYKENEAIDGMIEVVTTIKEKINPETSLMYCEFDTVEELTKSINTDLINLRYENVDYFEEIKNRFLPTVDFQELAIDNGWEEEYLNLASKFDSCYEKWKKQQQIKKTVKTSIWQRIKNWVN